MFPTHRHKSMPNQGVSFNGRRKSWSFAIPFVLYISKIPTIVGLFKFKDQFIFHGVWMRRSAGTFSRTWKVFGGDSSLSCIYLPSPGAP